MIRIKGTYKAADELRANIISTAWRFFKEYGFDKTTLKMIADELGITPGTITYHFKHKAEILFKFFSAFIESYQLYIHETLTENFNHYLGYCTEGIHFYRTLLRDERLRKLYFQPEFAALWNKKWIPDTHMVFKTISDDFHTDLSDEEIHVATLVILDAANVLSDDFTKSSGEMDVDKYAYHIERIIGLLAGLDGLTIQRNLRRAFEFVDSHNLPKI